MNVNSEFCLWSQADNDLRKFLAMREQALSNRDPGSDQETAREASDDSERLERGPNMVQIFVHPCPCVYVLPKYLPPDRVSGPFHGSWISFPGFEVKGRSERAQGEILSRGAQSRTWPASQFPIDTGGWLACPERPIHARSPNAPLICSADHDISRNGTLST